MEAQKGLYKKAPIIGQHGCPISSKITKLYFDLNIIQSTIGLKII